MDALLIAFGFVVGCLAGLLGIGGGMLIIPSLTFLAPYLGLPLYSIHTVSGLAAVQSLGASSLSAWVYFVQRRLRWAWVWPLASGGILGGFAGSVISVMLPEKVLYMIFIFFLMTSLVMTLFRQYFRRASLFRRIDKQQEPTLKQRWFLIFAGFVIGAIAGSLGVGGSVLVIPMLMTQFHQRTKHAIANSIGFVLITSLSAVLGKAVVGLIPIPQAFYLSLGSIAGGWVGARTNRQLPSVWLRAALMLLMVMTIIRTMLEIV